MEFKDAVNVVNLKLFADRMCEGEDKSFGLFLVDYQFLFELLYNDVTKPKEFIKLLGLAKSNLTILAKKLIKQGFVISNKEMANRKEIYYEITQAGKNYLNEKLIQIQNSLNLNKEQLVAIANAAKLIK